MATYSIGDIHGCTETLARLLRTIDYTPSDDVIWSVGDLVNNGPDSLGALRWAVEHVDVCTLGNHDLHLLAAASGARERRDEDTFDDVLEAPDRDDLLDWLRTRRLCHREGEWVMAHAGLAPAWTVDRALDLGAEVEEAIATDDFFHRMYGNEPRVWADELTGDDRLRYCVNAFTRMRVVDSESGALDFDFSGEYQDIPEGKVAWFEHPDRKSTDVSILFGHWSALGLKMWPGVVALDSGCVWGRALTAIRLEDRAVFQAPAAD